MSELIQLKLQKIMQTRAYTTIVLGTDEKSFAIYTDPSLGNTLQASLSKETASRPLTHSLITGVMNGLRVRLKQVVINDLQDTIFLCRLFLEQEGGERRHLVEIDGRPSDCLTLAFLQEAPIYCTRAVFDAAVPIEA